MSKGAAIAEDEFVDAEARRCIREDLDRTLFVEAAAGTGKTTALVGRIVAVIRSGRSTLDRIAAVTFTEKAAGEMKLRLRAEIESLRAASETTEQERQRLELAIEQLELARIGTIHAFCADLLHERPIEAGVDPLFEVLPEEDAEALIDSVFDEWFEKVLTDPPEGIRRALRRRPKGRGAQGPRMALRSAVTRLVLHRDFTSAWTREPFDRDGAIDALVRELREVGDLFALAEDPGDWLAKNLRGIKRFIEEVDLQERVRERDYDGLEAELHRLAGRKTGWHWRGSHYKGFCDGVRREQVLERRDRAKAALDSFLNVSGADLAACLREDLRPVVAAYEVRKRHEGPLDFLDLLIRARDLVKGDRALRAELQERFTHFFVDEFQDTDPLQAEILLLLSADDPEANDWRALRPVGGKLFFVGDPKQSIYRFRRADVALYESIKRRLAGIGARVVQLSTSFRSLPGLQEAINGAFSHSMRARDDGSQADYVPLCRYRGRHAGQPSLVALPVPRPYSDYGKITNYAIEASLPDATGAFVDWLVRDSGWTIEDREEPDRRLPIAARHICILFRRFQFWGSDVTRPYVQALEARRIPHVLVGGSSFHAREEAIALRNALASIEWPDDTLSVFATLRGPLFALTDDQILTFRDRVGSLHPLHRVNPDDLHGPESEVAEALAILARLHAGRNRRPIAETVHRLLHAVRAHAGIAIWPAGEQALSNCLRVSDRARRFERRGAASFRAFVEMLEQEAELGRGGEAPVVEQGTEGVRIMTVHKAKGLEFPVVVLADPTCRSVRDEPSQFVDAARGLWAEVLCGVVPHDLLRNKTAELERDRAESVRVAYVAATRARDLLVVPALGDEPQQGWVDVLNPVLYPERSAWAHGSPAAGCPEFGPESVAQRPARAGQPASIAPGLHVAEAGNQVVWWDPALLRLDVEQSVGLSQDKLLRADESGEAAAGGMQAHEQWQLRRQRSRKAGAQCTRQVETVTSVAAAASPKPGGEIAIQHVAGEREGRPRGKRFGTLVHAVLSLIDLDAGADAIRATAHAHSAMLGTTPEELEAAARAVERALGHPLLRRASQARDSVRRESPVMLPLPGDRIVEGVLDLAFREQLEARGQWTIVDFKTDHELGTRQPAYEEQLRLYVRAVEAATGESARGVLLVV
ncbi:MAG: UvrD-helicase domain-containing protein [Proteobacteria bacterium]|nr:UvrD-helicase domain-containing protein [Pseudomonadota bacterium]